MVMKCLDKSPVINVGQTFVTEFGNIRLISVANSSSGQIGIKPTGSSEVIVNTVDYRTETIGDMTVKTNFFTLAGKGAHFWVCKDVPAPVEKCTQVFKLQDQNGKLLDGNVSIGTTNITILGSGSISLEKGKELTAIASYAGLQDQTKTFTSCQSTVIFTFMVDEPDDGLPPVVDDEDEGEIDILSLFFIGIVILAALYLIKKV